MEVLSETPTASLFDDFFTLKPIFASDYCRLLQRTEAYRNSWTLDASVGHWTLNARPWTLDPVHWTLAFENNGTISTTSFFQVTLSNDLKR